MTRVGLLNHVSGKSADGVDAFQLERCTFVCFELGSLVVGARTLGRGFFHLFLLQFVYRVGHGVLAQMEVGVTILITQ